MNTDVSVLVIDDARSMRRTIRNILKDFGFKKIVEAEDGKEGLKILEQSISTGKFGLILCDWNMPNTSGVEVLQSIKANGELKDIPFIMVTAEGRKEFILDAIKEGADSFIVKPFTPDILSEKISGVL
ncbi:MAG: response regulator [Desulfobacterales bacterium]|nr:response regulator [Desulfobacterales bacterium]MCP4162618.1 response regulator [Deltaproteobacteria bacterium]